MLFKLVPIQGLLERYACLETHVLGVYQVNLIASESGERNKMIFIGKVSKISSTCVDIPNFVGVYEYTYPLPPF